MSNISETAYTGGIYTVGPRKASLSPVPVCAQILTYYTGRQGVGTQHLPLISAGGNRSTRTRRKMQYAVTSSPSLGS